MPNRSWTRCSWEWGQTSVCPHSIGQTSVGRHSLSIRVFGRLADPGARVSAVVYARQVLEIKMRIDLGRGDISVPQELLHAPQIATRFKQMRGKRMPEEVRVDLDAETLLAGPVIDAQLDGPHAQAPPAGPHEERVILHLPDRRPLTEPGTQGRDGVTSHGHDAHLVALAGDAHGLILEVEIGEPQAGELREPQPRRIEELHDGAVARIELAAAAKIEQARHLVRIERHRQALRRLRRLDFARGIRLELALANEVFKESADRGQAPLDAARPESIAVFLGREDAHVLAVDGAPAGDAFLAAIALERREVARVIGSRVRGHPPLGLEVSEISLDPNERGGVHQVTSAWAMSSPMRTRSSVFMPGWKCCASALPIASSPIEPLRPSGSSATEPISTVSLPKRKSRWVSRICPQRGFPDSSSGSNIFSSGEERSSTRRNVPACGIEAGAANTMSTELRELKSSLSAASTTATTASRPWEPISLRARRCTFSPSSSFARATSTSSRRRRSSALCRSRSASTWRSTSETAAPPRTCGRLNFSSTAPCRSKKSGLFSRNWAMLSSDSTSARRPRA